MIGVFLCLLGIRQVIDPYGLRYKDGAGLFVRAYVGDLLGYLGTRSWKLIVTNIFGFDIEIIRF